MLEWLIMDESLVMFKLSFFTSSQAKLANMRHLMKENQVEIVSFHENTYRANYDEPRIDDHQKLLQESFNDALERWKKAFPKELNSHTFFIEDTSVVIHTLSHKQDTPGPDIKYWMRDADFETVDKALKAKGNNRSVTVQSDILLYLPPSLRDSLDKKFAHFTSTANGFLVSKEYNFLTNPLYPWLDNKTFNKWFSPYKNGKPISMLSIEEADKYDFRKDNANEMLSVLNIEKKPTKAPELTKQLSLENFKRPPVFILCGPTCTGKTTLAEYLAKKYGFMHIEASDFMYLAFYQRHSTDSPIAIIDFAKQALEDIPHIVASQIIDYVGTKNYSPLVISGFRNIKEINWFSDNYFHSPVIPVYIDTDFDLRFERCKNRDREDFKGNKSDFKSTNDKQYEMGVRELNDKLSDLIENNQDKKTLYSLFEGNYHDKLQDIGEYLNNELNKKLTLEDWILLSLLEEYESHEYFTTTEISKLINNKLPADEKNKEKDNVSRYFNQTFHPYYEINKTGKFNKYRLSNTGYSLALQIKLKLTPPLLHGRV